MSFTPSKVKNKHTIYIFDDSSNKPKKVIISIDEQKILNDIHKKLLVCFNL